MSMSMSRRYMSNSTWQSGFMRRVTLSRCRRVVANGNGGEDTPKSRRKCRNCWAGAVTKPCVTAARDFKMARRRSSNGSIKSQKRKVAVDWNCLSQAQKFARVFRVFKSISAGGADGSIIGVNGSVNGVSTKLILDILQVDGKVVCDIGAADGKWMVCAALAGARQVVGVEFAQNVGYKMVLEAVVKRMKQEHDIEFNLDWIGSAIEDVRKFCSLYSCFSIPLSEVLTRPLFSCSFQEFQETHIVFMPTGTACPRVPRFTSSISAQGPRLFPALLCSTTRTGHRQLLVRPLTPLLCCTCDYCLVTELSIAVIESLNAFSDDKWVLRSTVKTRMYGSSAQHTAWVIDRIWVARPLRMVYHRGPNPMMIPRR